MAKHSRTRESHAAHPNNSRHQVHTGYAINLTETTARKPDHNSNASSVDKRLKSNVLSASLVQRQDPARRSQRTPLSRQVHRRVDKELPIATMQRTQDTGTH